MPQKDTTIIVAWWGAIVATVVLLWDIYKWRTSGPRILLQIASDRAVLGDPRCAGNTYVTVRVKNTGDRPTTIENLCVQYYSNWFDRIRNKPQKGFNVIKPEAPFPLPHVLEPGCVWDGLVEQNADIEQMARGGVLMCEVHVSHSKRSKRARIVIPSEKRKPETG